MLKLKLVQLTLHVGGYETYTHTYCYGFLVINIQEHKEAYFNFMGVANTLVFVERVNGWKSFIKYINIAV